MLHTSHVIYMIDMVMGQSSVPCFELYVLGYVVGDEI